MSYKPPIGAQKEAQKALDWREKYGDDVKGGTRIGWIRANQIAKREELSEDIVKRMHSFFSRHEGNQVIADEYKDEPWKDAGYVAWLLWGGDPAKTWSARIAESLREKSIGELCDRLKNLIIGGLHD